MTTVLSTGFDRTRLDQRLLDLQTAVRAVFGAAINLDPDTVDGQTLGIFAETVSNLDQLAEDVYHSFNPQSATGAAQSRLVQLNGIRRNEGAYSTVTVRLGGTPGTVIPAGSRVRGTDTGTRFVTTADATIGAGSYVDVACISQTYGPWDAPAGTLTRIDTPIYGWTTATNALAAVAGHYEESDSELRLRRSKSTSTPAQSIVDGIYGAVANISGVSRARVYENDTDVVDANGMPGHSVHVVVEGSDAQTIVDTIWLRKSVGATTIGSVTENAVDSRGGLHPLKYSPPTQVPIWVSIALTRRDGWPTSGVQLLKEALVEWALEAQLIGEPVSFSRLFTPLNSVAGHTITSLKVGIAAAPTGSVDIPIAYTSLAVFDLARINITVA